MITIEADDFEIEQRFAAALANSRGYAKLWNTAGCPQSHHDQVGCALIELWEDGRKAGLSGDEIQKIADTYVEYDDAGEALPRASAFSGVVPLRR